MAVDAHSTVLGCERWPHTADGEGKSTTLPSSHQTSDHTSGKGSGLDQCRSPARWGCANIPDRGLAGRCAIYTHTVAARCGMRQSRGSPRCIAGQANVKYSQHSSPTHCKYKQFVLLMAACSIISVLDRLVGSLGAAARCKLAQVVRIAASRGGPRYTDHT